MPYTKRRLTQSERVERLRRAEELLASGVDIVIPKEWRENCCSFDIMLPPPCDCLAWNGPGGQACYSVYLQICARQSALTYPEFDLEVPWDSGIVLATFEPRKKKGVGFKSVVDFKAVIDFGGQQYWGEEILNPRIENAEAFPPERIIYGCVLATGLRPIPAAYREHTLVPFHLILRDQFSGDIMERMQGNLAVARSREQKCSVPFVPEGLYGEPPKPRSAEKSHVAYQEILKQPKPQERLDEIMQYAALMREEVEREYFERKAEKARRRVHHEMPVFLRSVGSCTEKQPESTGPIHSVPRGFSGDAGWVVGSEPNKSRAVSHDPSV
ncbi:MAG TPA: hypothetical protein VEH30_02530 [Terriglobales bacterium]|nr:hypothetical protein [Terriglobales bacterium]